MPLFGGWERKKRISDISNYWTFCAKNGKLTSSVSRVTPVHLTGWNMKKYSPVDYLRWFPANHRISDISNYWTFWTFCAKNGKLTFSVSRLTLINTTGWIVKKYSPVDYPRWFLAKNRISDISNYWTFWTYCAKNGKLTFSVTRLTPVNTTEWNMKRYSP